MTNPDWFYDTGAVLKHPETGDWWHVLNRYRDVDKDRRYYRLADATHTEYMERAHADYVEGDFESAGWRTNTKPAAERGYRVNGVLCGPGNIQKWKGKECVHDLECPSCGSDGMGEIDVIHDHSEDRVYGECRVCNEMFEPDSDE